MVPRVPMSSPETFIAFAAIMFVIALIGAAIDWFGTPLRHRKFVPKAYRFPDERLFRNESLQNPNVSSFQSHAASPYLLQEEVIANKEPERPDIHVGIPLALEDPPRNEDTPEDAPFEPEGLFPPPEGDDAQETDQRLEERGKSNDYGLQTGKGTSQKRSETLRLRGWTPGGYIYNLTQDGKEPSPATVRARYWKNVSAAAGSTIFGAQNIERMKDGKPPQRRNYQSGKNEMMRISPKSFEEAGGEIPIPYWPSSAVDPFGSIE
ncbi:MAG: hypothetical protein VX725_02740 [Actinomycetota bacterium]|nr:hypothetical protein [Actinomycetota bacterium]